MELHELPETSSLKLNKVSFCLHDPFNGHHRLASSQHKYTLLVLSTPFTVRLEQPDPLVQTRTPYTALMATISLTPWPAFSSIGPHRNKKPPPPTLKR